VDGNLAVKYLASDGETSWAMVVSENDSAPASLQVLITTTVNSWDGHLMIYCGASARRIYITPSVINALQGAAQERWEIGI
jgi:hypothetical protein